MTTPRTPRRTMRYIPLWRARAIIVAAFPFIALVILWEAAKEAWSEIKFGAGTVRDSWRGDL